MTRTRQNNRDVPEPEGADREDEEMEVEDKTDVVDEDVERFAFIAPAGDHGANVTVSAEWFKNRITTLRNRQTEEARNLAAGVRERDRLHYDATALREHERTIEGRTASTDHRKKQHDLLMATHVNYEDFLFYQNPVHRRHRLNVLKPEGDRKPLSADDRARAKTSLSAYYIAHDFARSTLDHYDKLKVGDPEYRAKRSKPVGHRHADNDPVERGVRFPDLHLWTPRWRRPAVGVGRAPRDPDEVQSPISFGLDIAGIEQRRAEIEGAPSQACTVGLMPIYGSHSERRERQRSEALRHGNEVRNIERQGHWRDGDNYLRPSTSQMRLQKIGDTFSHQERLEEIQTESGLFVAAKESSFDWRTSYDCLGLVKQGYTIDGSKIYRDEDEPSITMIPEGGGDETDTSNDSDETMKGDDKNDDEDLTTREKTQTPPEDGANGAQIKPSEGETGEQRMARETQEAEEERQAGEENKPVKRATRKPRKPTKKQKNAQATQARYDNAKKRAKHLRTLKSSAGYEYQYEANEFIKPRKGLRDDHMEWATTVWAEATDGRRERHIGQLLTASSPPASPPRLNFGQSIVDDLVPEAIADQDIASPTRQRCKLDPKCRTWWSHTDPKDCWQANLESALYLGDHDEDPIRPAVPTINGGDCLLPISKSGREIYKAKLPDHYGLAKNGGLRWPTIGMRMPYGPTTIMDDAGPKLSSGQGPADVRMFPVTRSLAVPLIGTPQRPWNVINEDDPGVEVPEVDEGSESDDSGDMFRAAYHNSD